MPGRMPELWFQRLGELEAFVLEHDRLPGEMDNLPALWRWVGSQRSRRERLDPERLEALKPECI